MFEGAKQAVKLHLGRLVPVHLHQAGEQGVLLVVEKEAVGQVEVESVAGVHLRRAQAEEQAEPAGQAGENQLAPTSGYRPMPISGIARRLDGVTMRIPAPCISPMPPPIT